MLFRSKTGHPSGDATVRGRAQAGVHPHLLGAARFVEVGRYVAVPGEPGRLKEGDRVGILGWIILGLLAGAIAKAVLPGDDPGGIIVTMIIGIVGALLGGFLAQAIFDVDTLDEFFDLSTWLTAIVGAIILLLLYRLVAGRGRRRV
jgi:uncharacterized membrane protein YeaQ/YmgE (transglycosylase-associated protein family)